MEKKEIKKRILKYEIKLIRYIVLIILLTCISNSSLGKSWEGFMQEKGMVLIAKAQEHFQTSATSEEIEVESTQEEGPTAIGKTVIQTGALNVRETPNGKILGTVAMNESYMYYEKNGGWLLIAYGDDYGYIYARYTDSYDLEGNLLEKADIPQPEPEVKSTPEVASVSQPVQETVSPELAMYEALLQAWSQGIAETPVETVAVESLDQKTQLCLYVLNQVSTPGMSEMELVTAVNDYLCNTITYDKEYFTTVDALTLGRARCQGYANAFKNIMEAAGVPTDYVRGYVIGDASVTHAWNRVYIDGVYYCVDVTWNDSQGVNNWLLVPEAEFNVNHQIIEYNPSWTDK